MQRIDGCVAFVTGAASGIGFGIATALGRAGAKVMLADIEEQALGQAVAKLKAANLAVGGMVSDVADLKSVEHAADATLTHFGRVDIVCNNAGVYLEGPIETWTDEGWRWVLDVNLMGIVHGVKVFAPMLKRQGSGHMVNTASVAGLSGGAFHGQYVATKFAVVGLSQCLRDELSPHGIGVSVLCPGFVKTNIMAAQRNAPPELARRGMWAPSTLTGPQAESMQMLTAGVENGADPQRVGEIVREAISENAFYIFTDNEFEAQTEEWLALMRLGWERARKRQPG
jgi:NAD(P)-dependent dehydrogenase (short-subunit alcohol dehydrogenase family)